MKVNRHPHQTADYDLQPTDKAMGVSCSGAGSTVTVFDASECYYVQDNFPVHSQ